MVETNTLWPGIVPRSMIAAGISPDNAGTDLFVMGEVNGTSNPGDVMGNNMPSHYATFLDDGTYQAVYKTMGTPDYGDDEVMVEAGTFRAYRYDEGDGHFRKSKPTGPDGPGRWCAD